MAPSEVGRREQRWFVFARRTVVGLTGMAVDRFDYSTTALWGLLASSALLLVGVTQPVRFGGRRRARR